MLFSVIVYNIRSWIHIWSQWTKWFDFSSAIVKNKDPTCLWRKYSLVLARSNGSIMLWCLFGKWPSRFHKNSSLHTLKSAVFLLDMKKSEVHAFEPNMNTENNSVGHAISDLFYPLNNCVHNFLGVTFTSLAMNWIWNLAMGMLRFLYAQINHWCHA